MGEWPSIVLFIFSPADNTDTDVAASHDGFRMAGNRGQNACTTQSGDRQKTGRVSGCTRQGLLVWINLSPPTGIKPLKIFFEPCLWFRETEVVRHCVDSGLQGYCSRTNFPDQRYRVCVLVYTEFVRYESWFTENDTLISENSTRVTVSTLTKVEVHELRQRSLTRHGVIMSDNLKMFSVPWTPAVSDKNAIERQIFPTESS